MPKIDRELDKSSIAFLRLSRLLTDSLCLLRFPIFEVFKEKSSPTSFGCKAVVMNHSYLLLFVSYLITRFVASWSEVIRNRKICFGFVASLEASY